MMEDYKGSATSFFPPSPRLCWDLHLHCAKWALVAKWHQVWAEKKHDPAVRSQEATFVLHSLIQETVQRLNMEMI